MNGDSDEDADDDSLEDLLTPDDDGSGDPPVIIYPEDPSDLVFNNNLARVSGASSSPFSRTDIRTISGSQGHLTN